MELQRSNVRQTRSMTRAAAKKTKKSNLQTKERDCEGQDLGATMIDPDRVNERDCAGCDRINSAEMYMVQCCTCNQWYHFSCGNVTSATVYDSAFRCVKCTQHTPIPPPSSFTGGQSNKSSRRAQIDRELERLEEEKRLMDEMESQQLAQEQALLQKARLEKMERMKLYLAKKYDLQSQQGDCDEDASVHSFRSNRTSRNRVGEWILSQRKVASDTGLVIAKRVAMPLSVDPIHPKTATPVERLDTNFASTPLAKEAGGKVMPPQISLDSPTDVNTNSFMHTIGSAEVDLGLRDDSDAVLKGNLDKNIVPAIPQVNVQPLLEMLEEAQAGPSKASFVPETGKIIPSYEHWRQQTEGLRNPESQNRKECERRMNRELALAARVKVLEVEREKVLSEQQRKEREMQVQLQCMQQSQQLVKEQNDELNRLRALEREFNKQLALQQQQAVNHASTTGSHTNTSVSSNYSLLNENPSGWFAGGANVEEWCISDVEQPKQLRKWKANDVLNNAGAVSVSDQSIHTPPLSEINCSSSFSYRQPIDASIETPFGGRTNYTMSSSSYVPHMPQITIPHMPQSQPCLPSSSFAPQSHSRNMVPTVTNVPTTQQIAARQVVSRELPIFTGDPIDWPLFISSYQHSTEVCGFSDSENLLRLQRCLKGSAKEAVSSFLLHPSTVSQVLATLQTLYGRPEQIVQTMVAKVRETPAPKANRLETLVKFGLTVQNLAAHLRAIGQERHLSNPVLLQELVDKLPDTVKFNWALYQQQFPLVNLSTFSEYMAKVASATSGVTSGTVDIKHAQRDDRKLKEKGYINTHSVERDEISPSTTATGKEYNLLKGHRNQISSKIICPICNGFAHQTINCATFKKLNLDEKWKIVKERKLCRRCLTSHAKWPCKGEICGVNGCQKRHNRLLHYDQLPTESNQSKSVNATVTIHRQAMTSTLFRMIPVTLYGNNKQITTLAFLDDGSSVTLVEQMIVDSLGIEGSMESLCIQWTGGINKKLSDAKRVEMQISSADGGKKHAISGVYTVANLGLPEQTLDFDDMVTHFKHLRGLPVKSFKSSMPGILIGLNNTHLLATLKLREGLPREPIATKTRLGWTVYGSVVGANRPFQHRQMHICAESSDQNLHEYVRSFFSIESLGVAVAPQIEGADIQRARHILEKTTTRTSSGRFSTGLLWKQDEFEFPNSRLMAEKRLSCLEKRLARDPELYDNVRRQIAEYQEKKYVHKATAAEMSSFNPSRVWYLPIGIVLNPKKPGKVRLIWDAAAKVSGVSLNTMLLKGPDLLTPLLSVLFQYRQREVAICSDIKEMFHQILIREEDRSAQLFLWRDNPEDPIQTMVTDVAIFGASCSPAQAQYIKNLNATDYELEHPKAVDAIKNRHYVDDYLESVDTVDEAVEIALEVTKVHAKAGFQIRNWLSNNRVVLERIGEANPSAVKQFVADKESQSERLLGMIWQPEEDMFSFSLSFRDDMQRLVRGEVVPTKRELLRVLMSIYDPLGLVAAFVIHGKVIIQEVWRAKTDWDDKIPEQTFFRWTRWLTVLQKVEKVKIARCYFPAYDVKSFDTLELHIFVDASEEAFAAVAYFRIVDRGQVRCTLVASKTKVAPLEPLSIPRLELMAAVIGARLRKTIETGHTYRIKRTCFWSDSSTVRSWIKSDLRRYRPYVAFRVNEILTLSSVSEWRWVPTRLNPSDEATKWGKNPTFDPNGRWFKGPQFLYDDEDEWPKDPRELNETAEELRPAYVFAHLVVKPVVALERFSKWERLLRSLAYVHRFIKLFRNKRHENVDLKRKELQEAERSLWRLAQAEDFPDEVATLKYNAKVNEQEHRIEKGSPIASASPMLDDYGVMRVGGRMENADCISFEAKYPIILPKNHRVTKLLLDWYHRKYRHANEETIVNEVKQRFYVPRLRVLLKLVKKECIWCRVYKSVPAIPKMGPLPRVRLTPFVRPFTFSGIDYFGPYMIKIGRSAVKRWVVLFTCLTVRAIHLEVAASLSTDSCKKAIRRFIARRGAPQEIFTDNGTNFVGASRELREELNKMNAELGNSFTDGYTQWRFNPPAAPHMGGCWERMVRSVKVALGVLPIESKLDEESFSTLLAEAEHMINSRPLTFVPLGSEDSESLSPNHFLMLSSNGVQQSVKSPINEGAAIRGSWDLIQKTLDHFWRRWIQEYLPTITRRTKWFSNVREIRPGELVLIVDEKMRNKWIRGRVLRTFPGRDGIARRADVLTAGGTLQRPIAKLALLDIEVCDAESETQATRGGECSVQTI